MAHYKQYIDIISDYAIKYPNFSISINEDDIKLAYDRLGLTSFYYNSFENPLYDITEHIYVLVPIYLTDDGYKYMKYKISSPLDENGNSTFKFNYIIKFITKFYKIAENYDKLVSSITAKSNKILNKIIISNLKVLLVDTFILEITPLFIITEDNYLLKLPPELLGEIVSNMDITDLINLCTSDRRLNFLCEDEYYINLIKSKYVEGYFEMGNYIEMTPIEIKALELFIKYKRNLYVKDILKILEMAIRRHITYLVRILLIDDRIDPFLESYFDIFYIIRAGYDDIVDLYLDLDVDFNKMKDIIDSIARYSSLELIKKLVSKLDIKNKNILFHSSCLYANFDAISYLITLPEINPSEKIDSEEPEDPENYPFLALFHLIIHYISYESYSINTVKYINVFKLFLNDERVDPTIENNYVLRVSIYLGLTEFVELLLNDRRIDPKAPGLYALTTAVVERHPDIIYLLLRTGKFNDIDKLITYRTARLRIGDSTGLDILLDMSTVNMNIIIETEQLIMDISDTGIEDSDNEEYSGSED